METLLEGLGLTRGESKVYLTLLNLGETTTGKVIEDAQISAGKVYQILDKLIKKGLASYIVREKTKYFSATHPRRILDLLQDQERKIKQREAEVREALPLLISSYKSKKKEHETTLFKGFKGMQSAIYELLESTNPSEEIVAMGLRTSKEEKFNILWEKWHRDRIKRKIKCRSLFSEIAENYSGRLKNLKLTNVKVLKGITPSAVAVSDKIVLIQTYGLEPSFFLIRDNAVAESFKTFFDSLWDQAED